MLLLIFTFALSIFLIATTAYAASQSHGQSNACEENEQTIFLCRDDVKTASLCASKAGRSRIYMQYKFTRHGKIEMAYPFNKQSTRDAFHISSTSYSGGGETHVRFSINQYDYIIYDRAISSKRDRDGRNFPQFDAGILVKKDGKPVRHIKCADDALASIHSLAYEVLEREPYEDLNLR